MADLKLVKPCLELEDSYLDMIREWTATGEKMVPWILNLDAHDFPALLRRLEDHTRGIGADGPRVEHSTYWLVDKNKQVIGAVNIRHRLNQALLNSGGHIGYGVRPSERRKGYAREMLRLALEIARSMGIEQALVTCDKNNLGSARTIIQNGGVLDSEDMKAGIPFQRYWINLM